MHVGGAAIKQEGFYAKREFTQRNPYQRNHKERSAAILSLGRDSTAYSYSPLCFGCMRDHFFASFLNEIWYNIIFYGLLSLFAVAYIGLALALIIAVICIHNDKFEIFTDKLIGLEDEIDTFFRRSYRPTRYTLHFCLCAIKK